MNFFLVASETLMSMLCLLSIKSTLVCGNTCYEVVQVKYIGHKNWKAQVPSGMRLLNTTVLY